MFWSGRKLKRDIVQLIAEHLRFEAQHIVEMEKRTLNTRLADETLRTVFDERKQPQFVRLAAEYDLDQKIERICNELEKLGKKVTKRVRRMVETACK